MNVHSIVILASWLALSGSQIASAASPESEGTPPEDNTTAAPATETAEPPVAEGVVEETTEAEPEPEPEPAPQAQSEGATVQASATVPKPGPADAAAATEGAEPEPPAKKKDDCREGGSPLLPKGELDLVCKHPVEFERMTFKPGTGLVFKSKDGRFAMAPRLRAQLLWTLENDNEEDDVTQGLQFRRARLQFKGHVFNEHNKFKTEFAFSPRDQSFDGTPRRTPILDWYFDFDYLKSLTLRIGQYKVPYNRQRVISSGDLELVDRALAQGEFTVDRDIGFDLRSKDFLGLGKLRYYAGMWMGEGRDYRSMDTFEFMYIGRVEVLPFGMFTDYKEADFERSKKPRLSLGGAYAFIDAAKRNRGIIGSVPSDGGTTDTHNVTADFQFKIVGLSASGEFYWRKGLRDFGNATTTDDMGNEVLAPVELPRDGVGWYGQMGYLIPRVPLQVAGRYSATRRRGSEQQSSMPNRDEAGGGLSWYFARHPLKLQLDYFRVWEEQITTGTDRVRLQLQLAF